MYGVTERRLHAGFEEARTSAPCVLFLDELDAFAYARRKQQGSAGRALVDQLLQELDAIGSDNRGLLVLAATNAPWDVDDALKRPGRFDRVVFVPPPDPEARLRILSLALEGRPVGDVDLGAVVERTPLFSGADLHALVERAVDAVIDAALGGGGDDIPISQRHLRPRSRAPVRRPPTGCGRRATTSSSPTTPGATTRSTRTSSAATSASTSSARPDEPRLPRARGRVLVRDAGQLHVAVLAGVVVSRNAERRGLLGVGGHAAGGFVSLLHADGFYPLGRSRIRAWISRRRYARNR